MFLLLIISALIIGASLGLLGAGGSILTVPVLLFIMGLDEKQAIASSFIIIALISSVGGLKSLHQRMLNIKTLLWFALASFPLSAIGAYLGAIMPDGFQTQILIIVMFIAAAVMLSKRKPQPGREVKVKYILVAGCVSGLITGLVGVGGGFIIVPALVIFAGLSMSFATATSLALVTVNAVAAFAGLLITNELPVIDWTVVIGMSVTGALAVIGGRGFAAKLPDKIIKKGFAILLLMIAVITQVMIFI
ncbi:sulfite exporter TauE/SafE family protein [Aliiglaciecola litoralis]|uniref:Probable membrane transporter protein n=1 Tax=Aliiglaciecola litoralis TaxID=582857 RepID=A0ABN1LD10_9ALTE